ncbi:isoaspartyl peptidase/L-asparaginase [Cutibacterium sp. WCA-380-WT-3A]|uniref:Isoaspartyl peptidase/L-asparaginase n=1 Tax=Cutibacterium porci TaxID=2605781 RepID=A0A7K0J8P3_9ACTN|nr:isoaspartyl peptidase/L-asparaginase [Cutibacterium porci]MSS46334.1 isoaspartyl peptidase/L-asparaginase [Cutibacterium porci]
MTSHVVNQPGPTLVIHGGAGNVPSRTGTEAENFRHSLRQAFAAGQRALDVSARDAVIAAVMAMEDDPLFNAGRGGALAENGTVEADAAIMTGDGRAGAVCCSHHARNPIQLALKVLTDSPHVLLCDPPAQVCREWGLDVEPPEYFVTSARRAQLERVLAGRQRAPRHGTVGAVARDRHGHLAAATSTGGIVASSVGRIGDSPVIGAGTFARNGVVAVCCTGDGEAFLQGAVAHEVDARMRLAGQPVDHAALGALTDEVSSRCTDDAPATGGLIAVDSCGRLVVCHVSASMLAAWPDHGDVLTSV